MKIITHQEAQKPSFLSDDTSIPMEYLFSERIENTRLFFETLRSYLVSSNPEEVLVVSDNFVVQLFESEEDILKIWKNFNSEIVFAASANFYFTNDTLRYYYWKFYPRQQSVYDFLDPHFFIGQVSSLKEMVNDIIDNYDLDGDFCANDLFHRIYVDSQTGLIQSKYKISLDHFHKIVGSHRGRLTVLKWPLFSKIHSFLFFKEEEKILKINLSNTQNQSRDYQEKKSRLFNKKTNSFPAIFIAEAKEKSRKSFYTVMLSLIAYLKSIYYLSIITYFNKGNISQEKIFRYSKNKGKELNKSMSRIMSLLKTRQPFSFSHFNDGEISFIQKYENKNHKEVWFGGRFGRFQDQYDQKLGELLVDSFKMQQQNYFVGVPCKSCHPRLHDFAKKNRQLDLFTIPAMTFHHNLSYYPEIIGLIKNRKSYFVINPHQDLSFFKQSGFNIEKDQYITVPFKNAHKEYDRLKNLRFEEGSVVLLMCGMLAKILCANWFKSQPSVTFIAFGSSFDDFIQTNINFRLFPKNYPFSRHIIGSRGYLFGSKPECKVCFDLSQPTTENKLI